MKKLAQSPAWLLSAFLLGVAVLALAGLILTDALPGSAALPGYAPEALTKEQAAAILGAHTLLLPGQQFYSIYLPVLNK